MKRVIAIGLFFLFIANILSAQTKLTLQESIDIAIKNNIEVKQRDLLAEAAKVNYKQAKTNLFPTVNGNISHGINQGRSIDPFTNSYANQNINYASYGIGSDVILFNGLTLQNAIRQNAFAYDAAKMELQQAKDNLTLAVILAYLQVLSNEDQVALANQQVMVAKVQIDRLEKLNKEGAINPPQLFDLRGQVKEAELNRVTAQNALAFSKLTLTQLMNIAYDMYRAEQRVGKIAMIFSVLGILIACLGLFGLATFVAEQRTKEIGIRKVLGATVNGLVGLLSKDFVKLVLIAFVIAAPLAWYFMNKWLEDFEYRITIQWTIFLAAGLIALLIAIITISFQAIKAAIANPVKNLRTE